MEKPTRSNGFAVLQSLAVVLSLGLGRGVVAEETPPPAPPAPPAPAAPAAPAATDGDAQKRLEQQADADKRLRDEISTQAQSHLEAGKRLFSAFEYEASRAELERAVSLDRGSEEARKWLLK